MLRTWLDVRRSRPDLSDPVPAYFNQIRCPTAAPRFERVRDIPSIEPFHPGGHGELALRDCRVGPEALVGQAGQGPAQAQLQLEGARLFHCMRFIGLSIRHESSMDQVFVSEAVNSVADKAVQLTAALGISEDLLLSMILRRVRPFRIHDGASEVHRAAITRRAFHQPLRA